MNAATPLPSPLFRRPAPQARRDRRPGRCPRPSDSPLPRPYGEDGATAPPPSPPEGASGCGVVTVGVAGAEVPPEVPLSGCGVTGVAGSVVVEVFVSVVVVLLFELVPRLSGVVGTPRFSGVLLGLSSSPPSAVAIRTIRTSTTTAAPTAARRRRR